MKLNNHTFNQILSACTEDCYVVRVSPAICGNRLNTIVFLSWVHNRFSQTCYPRVTLFHFKVKKYSGSLQISCIQRRKSSIPRFISERFSTFTSKEGWRENSGNMLSLYFLGTHRAEKKVFMLSYLLSVTACVSCHADYFNCMSTLYELHQNDSIKDP